MICNERLQLDGRVITATLNIVVHNDNQNQVKYLYTS